MNRGHFPRVGFRSARPPYTSYSAVGSLNAKAWRTFAQGGGKPKLIADPALYSLLTRSPTKLFVGGCVRLDTDAYASA
jgi:hypothetical protein